MLIKGEGIIFRTTKYGESSVIIDILSPHQGLNTYILGGVRKRKSKLASIIQVLNMIDFVSYFKDNDSISRIKEVQLNHVYIDFPFNVVKSTLGLFLTEICQKSLKGGDQFEDVYFYIKSKFIELDETQESVAHFHIAFLIDLLPYLGIGITNNYNASNQHFNLQNGVFGIESSGQFVLDLETSIHLHSYLKGQPPEPINKTERKNVLSAMLDFYRYHIDDFGVIKSLDVLESLYE